VGGGAVCAAALAVADLTGSEPPLDPDTQRSPVHRSAQPPARPANPPGGRMDPAAYPDAFRTIDGTGNNPAHPEWGAAGIALLRLAPPAYADGAGAPAGPGRVSARVVSNAFAAQSASVPNAHDASDYLWQWGQFLDHDIDETPVTSPGEAFDIPVPAGDDWFDPDEHGDVVIPLDRSAYDMVAGVRQQLNNITAFIDASMVYGASLERSEALRALDGSGRLRTSAGDLLPFNTDGLDNAPTAFDPSYFLAGDIRANEQVALTAMHTLFMREHNFWADQLRAEYPRKPGDTIYEMARAIVAAEIQAITYREFLPVLLGPGGVPPYQGYRPAVNPGISNTFATAAYRVGHTMLSSQLLRVDAAGEPIAAGHLPLQSAFFNPAEITTHGIDDLLRGLAAQPAQEIDNMLVDDVRNFLFGPPGSGGFDLASLNVQRGRDHGIPSYNALRASVGLPMFMDFSQMMADPSVLVQLAQTYDTPDDIDAWVGLLCEPHRPGALVGQTLFRLLRDQFARLRDGDRFWYESYMEPSMVAMINEQTLATVIRRNTGVGDELPDDVFHVDDQCPADFNNDGMVAAGDFLALLARWGTCPGCPEDIDGNGVVDALDYLAFITSWGLCP
jgi:hypothetical protein